MFFVEEIIEAVSSLAKVFLKHEAWGYSQQFFDHL